MAEVKNLSDLIRGMKPTLQEGEYVFVSVKDVNSIDRSITLAQLKEKEGITVILKKEQADQLGLAYHFVAAWITLMVHSSLEAVGSDRFIF